MLIIVGMQIKCINSKYSPFEICSDRFFNEKNANQFFFMYNSPEKLLFSAKVK